MSCRDGADVIVAWVLVEDVSGSTAVDLEIVGYQFPDYEPRDGELFDEWDANWLVVRGHLVTPEVTWSFRNPCLTTDEVARLGAWLRSVASGRVSAQASHRRAGIAFTEPNISVRLATREGDLRTLEWYFAQEASPPEASEEIRYGDGHPVQTTVPAAELVHAAETWLAELARFPRRIGN